MGEPIVAVTVTETLEPGSPGLERTVVYEVVVTTSEPGDIHTATLEISTALNGEQYVKTVTVVPSSVSDLIASAERSTTVDAGDPDAPVSTSHSSFTWGKSSPAEQPTDSIATATTGSSTSTGIPGSASLLPASGSSISASPTAAPVAQHQNHALSNGAVAGIAAGCFVAGLLAAALAAFLLLACKRKRHRHYDPAATYEMKEPSTTTTPEIPMHKTPSVAVSAFAPGSAAAIVEDALPRPADDETLRLALASLRTQINNHVLSFYRSNPSQEQVPLETLAAVLPRSGISAEDVQSLLQDHRTRTAAMRFVVAWAAMSRMDGSGEHGSTTFLPDQLTSLHNLVASSESHDEARGAFLSRWRTVTAYLLSPGFEQVASDHGRGHHKADDAVAAVDSVLKTYAKGDTSERLRNLHEIMQRAERLAFMLFAQPGEFRFGWNGAGQGIVVFPGLVQLSDENGRALRIQRVVLEEDIVRI